MEVFIKRYPPICDSISATVWRGDGDYCSVDITKAPEETLEQVLEMIAKEIPEQVAIELVITKVRAVPIRS